MNLCRDMSLCVCSGNVKVFYDTNDNDHHCQKVSQQMVSMWYWVLARVWRQWVSDTAWKVVQSCSILSHHIFLKVITSAARVPALVLTDNRFVISCYKTKCASSHSFYRFVVADGFIVVIESQFSFVWTSLLLQFYLICFRNCSEITSKSKQK